MKVILGFNELKNDGMGSAAITLIKALRTQGLTVIPVHGMKLICPDMKNLTIRSLLTATLNTV